MGMTTHTPDELHLDPDMKAELRRLANAAGRDPSELLNEAAREYVSYTKRFLASIEAGIRDADEGRMYMAEEARAELMSRRRSRQAG